MKVSHLEIDLHQKLITFRTVHNLGECAIAFAKLHQIDF